MRITGGAARSIVLKTVDVEILRPDTDAMRVALFNSLGDVSGVVFYDLFAGCGATGLEALSRGAAKVVFIERHPKLSKVIAENLAAVAKSASRKVEECEVHRGDVFELSVFGGRGRHCFLRPALRDDCG
jgi:16S rRNA (guanine966-N2)-methyltransferase